jgi:hypothetical protein
MRMDNRFHPARQIQKQLIWCLENYNESQNAGTEVLTAAGMKISVPCDITPWKSVDVSDEYIASVVRVET